nr:hypothetical protein CFP56_54898 [Quercus suber]
MKRVIKFALPCLGFTRATSRSTRSSMRRSGKKYMDYGCRYDDRTSERHKKPPSQAPVRLLENRLSCIVCNVKNTYRCAPLSPSLNTIRLDFA